jgi:hypothetical protein
MNGVVIVKTRLVHNGCAANTGSAEMHCSLLETTLRSYKDLVYVRVQDQTAVRNFRAIELGMRRIRAPHNPGWIVRVSLARWISAVSGRVFLGSFLRRDGRCNNGTPRPFGFARSERRTASSWRPVGIAATAGSLGKHIVGTNQCKDAERHRTSKQHYFFIHSSYYFSQLKYQTDAVPGKFKNDLNNCPAIRAAFSALLTRYSFSNKRNLSRSIRRSRLR